MKHIWLWILLALIVIGTAVAFIPGEWKSAEIADVTGGTREIELQPKTVTVKDGKEVTYRIAKPFEVAVAAEGLGKARFMAMSPDGRMFVPDIVNYNLSREGKVYVLGDWNEETKRFESKDVYLSGLRGPNSIAFYRDPSGKDWLYLALTASLVRYPYKAGDTKPSGPAQVVTEFPNTQTPGETSVVWHITRTIKFHEGRLYVAIGSGCNSCEQEEGDMRAMVMVMDPDGSNKEVYADGLRNSVGMTFKGDTIYVTANGVDHLGADAPDELMHELQKGKHYGWPYCWQSDGVLHEETPDRWKRRVPCTDVPLAFTAFPPHSAPLGLEYFEDAHPVLDGSFLVALHGSFQPEVGSGYQIIRVSESGKKDVFMDGFQAANYAQLGRPVDILQRDANSFFVTDDFNGMIYLIYAAE